MRRDPATLDCIARRLVQSSEKHIRRFLSMDQLDPDLVARLYLQVRDALDRYDGGADIDELALALYLTAAAWQTSGRQSVDLLPVIHDLIRQTLEMDGVTSGKESS